ncbi:MAG TPA: DUF3089 domain-containing protein [Gaiellaceae bacterium]
MRRALVALAGAAMLLLAGSAAGAPVPAWKAWLCYPGTANDWCSVDLTTDVFDAQGRRTTVKVSVPADPPIDCFYVYPTVSEEHRGNATLTVEPAERETAITQAARFSHVCRVYAPLYRQTTGYRDKYHGNPALAYADVLAAWKDYLAHDNHGRGVVLIGHSQGASKLTTLIQNEIDSVPSERKLLVSAILLGGPVTVKKGSTVGGSFRHIPACTSKSETGCVIAYEAWDHTPPKAALDESLDPKLEYLCVNPAALRGGSAPITPIFAGINPQMIVPYGSMYVAYHWVEFPGLYTARCVVQGGNSWLLVSRIQKAGDTRPTVVEALGPTEGLHAADVNLTQADLVSLVGSQSRAWLAHH